jgi:hypothetical protein
VDNSPVPPKHKEKTKTPQQQKARLQKAALRQARQQQQSSSSSSSKPYMLLSTGLPDIEYTVGNANTSDIKYAHSCRNFSGAFQIR